MDALHARMESGLDVIMVGPWMLCDIGWSRHSTCIWSRKWMLGTRMRHPDGVGVRRNVRAKP